MFIFCHVQSSETNWWGCSFLTRASPWDWKHMLGLCCRSAMLTFIYSSTFSRHVRCWPSFPVGDDYYYSGPCFCFPSLQVSVWAAADQSSAPCRSGDRGRLNLGLAGKANLLRWDYFCKRRIKGGRAMLACREQWPVFQVKPSWCGCVYFWKECWTGEHLLGERMI